MAIKRGRIDECARCGSVRCVHWIKILFVVWQRRARVERSSGVHGTHLNHKETFTFVQERC